jgi:SAM-dependent methyltransferase
MKLTLSATLAEVTNADDFARAVREHFDALGEAEWDRLALSPAARVSLELHRRFLARFIRPGWRVLEIGAGPGRFTIELAALGATVVVGDISPVQLRLNRAKVDDAGCGQAVEDRRLLDIRDLSTFETGVFDAVVAYGGPISYAFEQASTALAECLRVTRPGGAVVASVMSAIGSFRCYLPGVAQEISTFGMNTMDTVLHTGDTRPTQAGGHACRMFRWRNITDMIAAQPCRLLAASASNAVSLGPAGAVAHLAADPSVWRQLLDWEEELAQEPGMLDGGTHILFALERLHHTSTTTNQRAVGRQPATTSPTARGGD